MALFSLKLILPMFKTLFLIFFFSISVFAQNQDSVLIKKIYDETLSRGEAYENLRVLCKNIGPRLSGSVGAKRGGRIHQTSNEIVWF